MSHTIEDMKSAYVFFNNARFGGSLPSPYGWRMSLCVGYVDSGKAECSPNRDRITFGDRHFGRDLHEDLYLLFHEMWHAYAGWEPSDSAHHVALSSHSGAWAAGMTANGVRVTSDYGHTEVIPGGSFDRLRDAWIDQWERGDAPSDDREAFPSAVIGIAAVMAVVVLLGISAIGDGGRENGYRSAYSNYDD
jgi:hypothetical protein